MRVAVTPACFSRACKGRSVAFVISCTLLTRSFPVITQMNWGTLVVFVLAFISSILTTFVCSAVVVLRIRGSSSLNRCIDSWTAAGLEAVLAGVSAAGLRPEADTRLSRAFIFQIHCFSSSITPRNASTDIILQMCCCYRCIASM